MTNPDLFDPSKFLRIEGAPGHYETEAGNIYGCQAGLNWREEWLVGCEVANELLGIPSPVLGRQAWRYMVGEITVMGSRLLIWLIQWRHASGRPDVLGYIEVTNPKSHADGKNLALRLTDFNAEFAGLQRAAELNDGRGHWEHALDIMNEWFDEKVRQFEEETKQRGRDIPPLPNEGDTTGARDPTTGTS